MNFPLTIRSLLVDQKILVVGGDPRPSAITRLESALQVAAVRHCPTRCSDSSPRRFAAALHDADLLLVVWVRGLSRTHHGTALHAECRARHIPFVDCRRIPHPDGLLAHLERLQLGDALRQRRGLLDGQAHARLVVNGGAA